MPGAREVCREEMAKYGRLELKADLFLQQAPSLLGPLGYHAKLEDHLWCT